MLIVVIVDLFNINLLYLFLLNIYVIKLDDIIW